MSQKCPNCQTPLEPDTRFCTECGATLAPEILVEVETNRQHILEHASMLRFRVTSTTNTEAASRVTIRMRLHGQGRFVEQEAEDIEQSCLLQRHGDPHIFALSFLPVKPGEIVVEELRVTVDRVDGSERKPALELPDKSLFVSVVDPTLDKESPNVVISGGIHIDFKELKEVYGSDIENILTINAQREAVEGQPDIEWQPIRLQSAEETPLPSKLLVALPGDVGLDLIRIPPGEFTMGSGEEQGKDDERPAHTVRITGDYYLGKFPVTQQQYECLMDKNPSKFPASPQHPVENVSWDDAREFCRRLRTHLMHAPGALGDESLTVDNVTLPTEAQWEHACRAGTETLFSFGDDRKLLLDYGWFDKNAQQTTHPVGQLLPNPRGLHDMHGNVWEWCEDFHAEDYASAGNDDPTGPAKGDRRVLRGGSWSYYAKDCRSARTTTAPPCSTTIWAARAPRPNTSTRPRAINTR